MTGFLLAVCLFVVAVVLLVGVASLGLAAVEAWCDRRTGLDAALEEIVGAPIDWTQPTRRVHTCAVCGAPVQRCGMACGPCADHIWQAIQEREVYDQRAVEQLHADLDAWNRGAAS